MDSHGQLVARWHFESLIAADLASAEILRSRRGRHWYPQITQIYADKTFKSYEESWAPRRDDW